MMKTFKDLAVILCLFVSISEATTDADWISLNDPGVSLSSFFGAAYGATYALLADSGHVFYAGGTFGILRWNGAYWKSVGNGISGEVHALAFDSSRNLYAGGNIPQYNNIAKWDGNAWSALGSGTKKTVKSIVATSTGEIYAGGLFDSIGGVYSKYVGKWADNHWLSLDADIDVGHTYNGGGVNAMVIDKTGNLYAGGDFEITGTSVSVAKWDGRKWSPMGGLSSAMERKE